MSATDCHGSVGQVCSYIEGRMKPWHAPTRGAVKRRKAQATRLRHSGRLRCSCVKHEFCTSRRSLSRAQPESAYSASFDFTQLRFCPRGLHTACDGAGDARGCPQAAGRCATWCGTPQKRRRHARFRGQHYQRCDVALRTTAVSGEPNQPFADRVSGPTIGTTCLSRVDSSVLILVRRFLHAIDFEMVGVERG